MSNKLEVSIIRGSNPTLDVTLSEPLALTEIIDSVFSNKIIRIKTQNERGNDSYLEIKITTVDVDKSEKTNQSWFISGHTVAVSAGEGLVYIKWNFVGYISNNKEGFLVVFCYKNKQKGGE